MLFILSIVIGVNVFNSNDITGIVDAEFDMTASIEVGNIMGTQFHPEKSLDAGLELLSRFTKYSKNVSKEFKTNAI